jgi:hypothetical protein
LIGLTADVEGCLNDFMSEAIDDWEKLNSMGEEIAASLFDAYFALAKNAVSIGLDIVDILVDTLDILPGGYLISTAVSLAFWAIGENAAGVVGLVESGVEMLGLKDQFVNSIGDMINKQIQETDSSFDPFMQQIMTESPGGSW